MRSPRTQMKHCSLPGCPAEFPDDAWGAIKAHEEGWFTTKDGSQTWCPEHVPEWVPAWRAAKAVQKVADDMGTGKPYPTDVKKGTTEDTSSARGLSQAGAGEIEDLGSFQDAPDDPSV